MIFAGSSTGIDIIFDQVMHQLLAREKVVKEDMVVFTFEMLCKIFDNSLAKVFLPTPLLACVDLELLKVAIMVITKHPYLDATFR